MSILRPQRDAIESILPKRKIEWQKYKIFSSEKQLNFMLEDGTELHLLGLSRPSHRLGESNKTVAVFGLAPAEKAVPFEDWEKLFGSHAAILLSPNN